MLIFGLVFFYFCIIGWIIARLNTHAGDDTKERNILLIAYCWLSGYNLMGAYVTLNESSIGYNRTMLLLLFGWWFLTIIMQVVFTIIGISKLLAKDEV